MPTESAKRRDAVVATLSEQVGRDLATRTVLFHHAVATRLGLSATDLKCLDLLRETDAPVTAGKLAELTGLSGGAVTGVADRLEAAGFVERVRDAHDRRRWELRPVPGRAGEIGTLFQPLAAAMAQLCDTYDDDALDVISDFLGKLGTVLENQTTQLRKPK